MPKKTKLLWRIYIPFLFISIAAFILIMIYSAKSVKSFYIGEVEDQLKMSASIYSQLLENTSDLGGFVSNSLCSGTENEVSTRITFISPEGGVLCDSEGDSEVMDNHSDRPEVMNAIRNNYGVSKRYSETLKVDLLYVAMPIMRDGQLVGIIRLAKPISSIAAELKHVYFEIVLGGLISLILISIAIYLVIKRFERPLKKIQDGARHFAGGDLNYRLDISDVEEIAQLAESMNLMASKLKRLENIRRDFVANVSHELKTPITAIKGFIETLKDGAIDDPENARPFLEIMSRHSDRLGEIIEDLLSLSRIEQESEKGEIKLSREQLSLAIESAILMCETKMKEKEITLSYQNDGDDFETNVNSPLLEQALINLIDNSIKYSQSGAKIEIRCEGDDREIRIHVKDNGHGIPKEHHERIFERFYRVDKARSRAMGGTGLGLAIVKHIVTAHGGYSSVQSQPGRGSVFTLHLPNIKNRPM